MYTFAIAATLLFVPFAYPFAPIQMTLIGAVASGIPGVLLALEPNFKRVPKEFIKTVLKRAVLGAATVFAGIMAVLIIGGTAAAKLSYEEISTICTVYTGTASLVMLLCTCLPLNKFKAAIVIGSSAFFYGAIGLFENLFMLAPLSNFGRTVLLCLLPLTLVQLVVRSFQLKKEKP